MPWLDPLLIAVQYKCAKTVCKLLKSKSLSPDGPFKDCITPLHIAVLNDDSDSVRHLIRHGADLNIPDHNGETALHLATDEATSLRTYRELLKAGPVLNIKDFDDNTPLHCLCLGPYFGKIKELLKQPNPPVNEKDEEGATPLHLLVHVCEDSEVADVTEIINRSHRKGFNVNSQTNAGETILHVASDGINRENLIQELLKLDKIDVKIQDEIGDNFLHTFLRSRTGVDLSEDFLCLLLEDSTLISKNDLVTILNQRNDDGFLPVTFYIKLGVINCEVVKRFLDYVANVDVQNSIGESLIHLTTHSALSVAHKSRIIRHAIKKNANVNIKDTFGRTPIFLTTELSILRLLVENGANVNATDQCKRTPLMATLCSCNPRICQYLINRGGRINMRDKFGHTALHYAAWENRVRELEVLIRSGADVFRKDKAGRTPRDIACYWRCRDAVDILGNAMLRNSCLQLKTKHKKMEMLNIPDLPLWVNAKRFILSGDIHSIPDIKKHFEIPNDVENYFEHLLQCPGIGLPGRTDEASWVESLVLRIIESIASRIGEVDNRFKCSVFRSGSTFEGTKIDDPDEFDFLFVLEKFSEIIQIKSNLPTDHPNYGFESPSCISEKVDTAFQRYFNHKRSLLCGRLRNDFFLLLSRILFSRNIWIFDEVYTDTYSISNIPEKPVVNFKIFLIGAFYKGISVSIDVVPALRVKNWRPDGANLIVNDITPNTILSKHFMLLCQEPDHEYTKSVDVDTSAFFRISCAPFEIELMQSLPSWVRQSYALAKMMKGNFMCPRIQFAHHKHYMASEEISSYMLKNCLFHILATRPDILQKSPFSNKSPLYNSVALALKIYKYLGEAAVSERLPVYFLPHLNIFREDFVFNEETSSDDESDDEIYAQEDTLGEGCRRCSSCETIKQFCELIIKLYSL